MEAKSLGPLNDLYIKDLDIREFDFSFSNFNDSEFRGGSWNRVNSDRIVSDKLSFVDIDLNDVELDVKSLNDPLQLSFVKVSAKRLSLELTNFDQLYFQKSSISNANINAHTSGAIQIFDSHFKDKLSIDSWKKIELAIADSRIENLYHMGVSPDGKFVNYFNVHNSYIKGDVDSAVLRAIGESELHLSPGYYIGRPPEFCVGMNTKVFIGEQEISLKERRSECTGIINPKVLAIYFDDLWYFDDKLALELIIEDLLNNGDQIYVVGFRGPPDEESSEWYDVEWSLDRVSEQFQENGIDVARITTINMGDTCDGVFPIPTNRAENSYISIVSETLVNSDFFENVEDRACELLNLLKEERM